MDNVADGEAFTISDLFRQRRPFSATSSVSYSSRRRLTRTIPQNLNEPWSPRRNPNSDTEFLLPLNYPVSLSGKLTLPVQGEEVCTCLYRKNSCCFRFCDDTSSVCCDVLDFDVLMLQQRVKIVSFNFLPFEHGLGFLEIIDWEFLHFDGERNSVPLWFGTLPATEDCSKAKYHVHGMIESLSPVSSVPCVTGCGTRSGNTVNLRGFLVKFLACECKLCSSKDGLGILMESNGEIGQDHAFTKDLFMYFCGYASSWHAAITKMVGSAIVIAGLKKKLIHIGKDAMEMMLVTTEKSVLHLFRPPTKWALNADKRISKKGNGECCNYTGLVSGVYMEGIVVELDKEVWLLLTDRQLLLPHGLRDGAMISVKNVHLFRVDYSWSKVIVLGACFRTSLVVESFSPFVSRCHALSQAFVFLGRFVASFTFSARLWVVLIASCFQKKFAGLLSEKQIWGMKNMEGLLRMYSLSKISPAFFQNRVGVFVEYCKHASCRFGAELCLNNLKLVVPFSLLICRCETIWADLLLESITAGEVSRLSNGGSSMYSKRGTSGQLIRRIISSRDIGTTLLGIMKISPSGWLQFVDGTYNLDVVIPDLPASWNSTGLYEVNDYDVILVGKPGSLANRLDYLPFSCRSIFNSCLDKNRRMEFDVILHFHWSKVTCRSLSQYSSDTLKSECGAPRGAFHLLRIVHKFPPRQKYCVSSIAIPAMLAEAILLPWDLFVAGQGKDVEHVSDSVVGHGLEVLGNVCSDWASVPCKRKKCVDGSSTDSCGPMEGDDYGFRSQLNSQKLPCLVTFRDLKTELSGCLTLAKVCPSEFNVRNGLRSNSSFHKLWLEFKSTDVVKFKVLNIGGYYMLKHQNEDLICKHFGDAADRKLLLASEELLWSISFDIANDLFERVCNNYVSRKDKVPGKNVMGALFRQSPTLSDCCVHVSADVGDSFVTDLLELEFSLSEEAGSLGGGFSDPPRPQEMFLPPLSSKLCRDHIFSEGDLVSISGNVVSVEILENGSGNLYPASENLSGDHLSELFFGTSISAIHVLMGSNMVFLSGLLRKQTSSLGLGPGVNATFHRVLKLRGSKFMFTPVTFIQINSLGKSTDPYMIQPPEIWFSSDGSFSSEIVSSSLISHVTERSKSSVIRLRGRVTSLHILMMEKSHLVSNGLHLQFSLQNPLIDIPIASFLFEDGKSSCLCWCKDKQASTLLGLYEKLPQAAFESRNWTLKWVKNDNNCRSSAGYLDKILKKHHRITVRNFGSVLDSSCQDLVISAGPDDVLRNSDEDLLKYIIFNSCSGRDWIIMGTIMDSDAARELEKHLCLQIDVELEGIQHVWVTEVSSLDVHLEAKKVLDELLEGG